MIDRLIALGLAVFILPLVLFMAWVLIILRVAFGEGNAESTTRYSRCRNLSWLRRR